MGSVEAMSGRPGPRPSSVTDFTGGLLASQIPSVGFCFLNGKVQDGTRSPPSSLWRFQYDGFAGQANQRELIEQD